MELRSGCPLQMVCSPIRHCHNLYTHLASLPLLSALPGPAAVWLGDCWLSFPRARPICGTISNRKGSVCTWRKKLYRLLFCLSKGQFSYASPPSIPPPVQFNFTTIYHAFSISLTRCPKIDCRAECCDIFLYFEWVLGTSFHLQNTYKMQGISFILFPAP